MNIDGLTFSPWVLAAAQMPLAFAQVREDPLIDRWVIDQCSDTSNEIDVIQIASGGCTAAVVAAMPHVARLHLVDPNPAQLALARVKLWLRQYSDSKTRMAVLGHATMPAALRSEFCQKIFKALHLQDDCLGPLPEVARLGPNHAGRYELVFSALRHHLAPMAPAINELLMLDDITEQQRRISPASDLVHAFDEAFAEVMSLANLVKLFGAGATSNAIQPFHRHFSARLYHVINTLPAATNPYLWQLLRGKYPPTNPAEWLTPSAQEKLAEISWTTGTMDSALSTMPERFHVVHLSNILDWLSPDEAKNTLALAWGALRPGGWVVIRQLNSSLTIPQLGSAFHWVTSTSLHQQDRSFFYRSLHLGRKS